MACLPIVHAAELLYGFVAMSQSVSLCGYVVMWLYGYVAGALAIWVPLFLPICSENCD